MSSGGKAWKSYWVGRPYSARPGLILESGTSDLSGDLGSNARVVGTLMGSGLEFDLSVRFPGEYPSLSVLTGQA